MFCTKCGAELEEGAAFCTKCGSPMQDASEQRPPDETLKMESVPGAPSTPSVFSAPAAPGPGSDAQAASGDDTTARRRKRIALIVLAALVVAACIAGIALFWANQGGSSSSSIDPGSAEQAGDGGGEAVAKTKLDMYVSQIDNGGFPRVTLYAHLADESGSEVSSIDASQLSVIEVGGDGSEHEASLDEVAPVSDGDAMSINLVLDQSASMSSEGKMPNAKSAANSFIDEIVKSGSSSTEITSFDDYVYNRQPFTTEETLLRSAVESLSPDGETALYDALYWALQRTNLKSGSRVVIAFTDGEENASQYALSDVEELSRLTGIPVYIVGIGDDVDASSLGALASACNGRYYDAGTADLAQALEGIYRSIYDDQRSMYRIVYTSGYTGDETVYRTVRLSCAEGGAFQGAAEATYMPVDNVSAYDSLVNSQDYVLADSASRYYSGSELEELSLWELYLARNEIFARHGRGFKNQDLVDYFATRSWYRQLYTPEEFDALASPLNDCERKNVEAMHAVEEERNSPYLVTAK